MAEAGRARRKVVFFAEAVTLAHMARPAVLAGMLAAEEFEVVLARDPRYMSLFADLQVRQLSLFSIRSSVFLQALAAGSPLYSSAVLERYVADDLRIIDAEEPDIVVGDFRLSLAISARLRNIPYVAIANAYWSPYARVDYPIPEHPLNRLLGVTLAQTLFRLVRPLVFGVHSRPLNRVRKRHGLSSLGWNLNRVYTDSDYLLYADIPSLVTMRALPAHHQFLGPVLWSPQQRYPDWWQEVDDSTTNIYLTPGSSGRSDLLPLIIDALRALPVNLLVATAGYKGRLPAGANIFTAEYLPGEAAAARSRLVICNGGSLTTYQAFSQGVPVLGIAGNLDQHLNMSAVERHGAGIRLRTDQLHPEQVTTAVSQLLEQRRYRERAEALRDQLAQIDIRENFSRLLRSL